MKLSSRLMTIAQLINENDVVADIGSDHGLLVLDLLSRYPLQPVYATELKEGPFHRLKRSLAHTSALVYQANGIEQLPSQVTTVVISGMGGLTIRSILDQLDHVAFKGKFIVSPQSDIDVVRAAFNEKRYRIIDEHMILDRKYYVIIVAVPGQQTLTPFEVEYGPILIQKKSPTFLKYVLAKLFLWRRRLIKARFNVPAKLAIENTIKELESLC